MFWELASRTKADGFIAELPAGTYYIGDARELVRADVYQHVRSLQNGVWQDTITDAIIAYTDIGGADVIVNHGDLPDLVCMSVSVVSEDIVNIVNQNHVKVVCDSRVVIEYYEDELTLKWGDNVISIHNSDVDDEDDEEMYTRLYAGQGVVY